MQRLLDLLARERLFPLDQALPAVDERHPRSERRPGLRHLHAHDATADDEQPSGYVLRGRRLDVRPRPRIREPGNRRDRRKAPRGDDDGAARDQGLVADPHAPLAVEPAVTADDGDAPLLEPRQHGRVVEVVDDLVTTREHRRDVELAGRDARHTPGLGGELTGAQERLRRHARIERALAADQPPFHHGDRQPGLAEAPRDHLTRCTGADHHHVELPHVHVHLRVRLQSTP